MVCDIVENTMKIDVLFSLGFTTGQIPTFFTQPKSTLLVTTVAVMIYISTNTL